MECFPLLVIDNAEQSQPLLDSVTLRGHVHLSCGDERFHFTSFLDQADIHQLIAEFDELFVSCVGLAVEMAILKRVSSVLSGAKGLLLAGSNAFNRCWGSCLFTRSNGVVCEGSTLRAHR